MGPLGYEFLYLVKLGLGYGALVRCLLAGEFLAVGNEFAILSDAPDRVAHINGTLQNVADGSVGPLVAHIGEDADAVQIFGDL